MDPNFSLKDRNILITGASSGIGKAVAEVVASHGGVCILCGRSTEKLEKVMSGLPGIGHCIIAQDLHDFDAAELVNHALECNGPLCGMVHCAGIEKTLPFRMTDLEDLNEILQINFISFWRILQELLKKKNHQSAHLSVAAISSAVGLYGAPGKVAYASSKGALISMIKSLAAEYASQNIRFNCIAPGYVDTPMLNNIKKLYKNEESFRDAIVKKHALGLGKPGDIANAALYLLSDASRWVTGTVLEVNGGYNL